MRNSRTLCKVLSLLCTLTLLLSSIPFTAIAENDNSSTSSTRVVYVALTGSDTNDGSKDAPFASYNKAVSELCDAAENGGIVVIMDDINPDAESENDIENYLHNSGLEGKYHNNLITFTGKDPIDGTIYPAVLRYGYWGLHGPTKFEYLTFAPNRAHFRINTCGYPLTIGRRTSTIAVPNYISQDDVGGYGVHFHDGVGETTGSTTVSSTNTTIESGSFGTFYIGGGYPTNSAHGITGNCHFTMTGGTVGALRIGYDYYLVNHTTGIIGGNVTIELSGDATVNNIAELRRYTADNDSWVSTLTTGKIGGALTIITNDDATYSEGSLPAAEKGVWQISVGKHGKVTATDTPGVFCVTPDTEFYDAYIGDTKLANGNNTIPSGKTTVTFKRSSSVTISDNSYVKGLPDGNFEPDAPLTRAEGVSMLYSAFANLPATSECAFTDIAATDWYYESASTLSAIGVLPKAWGTKFSPNAFLTRAEFIYIAENLFIIDTTAHKLLDFSDVTEKHLYYSAITSAAASGKISGYADGSFAPDKTITRAEAVTAVNRYAGRNPLSETDAFSDVTSTHWANKQIAAASMPLSAGNWNKQTANPFTLPENSTTENAIKSLYNSSTFLSGEQICDGIDKVAEQMKKNVLETGNTKDLYPERFTSDVTVYYISEKNGDDSNDGLSENAPVKTIAGLDGKCGTCNSTTNHFVFSNGNVALLFERGGIYRGSFSLNSYSNILFGAYGNVTESKPLIMQSRRNYADPNLWVAVDGYPNLWKCTEKLKNVGVMGFDHDLFDCSDDTYNELYGQMMNEGILGFSGNLSELTEDLQFYSVVPYDATRVQYNLSDPVDLYLYCENGNPGNRFQSIEIGECTTIITAHSTKDTLIDNLAFKFTGAHAIGGGYVTNRIVTNCVFSWLGGSLLNFTGNGVAMVANYGNAVEVYGGCDGYTVDNCWMYQIFDTGVTHQYNDQSACLMKNITYQNLLIEYCFWGIEIFNNKRSGNSPITDENKYTGHVNIFYNLLRSQGYGWGSVTRQRDGRAYCISNIDPNNDNEITEYNIFDRCNGYLLYIDNTSNEVDRKNIYVQTIGKMLGNLKDSNYSVTVCGMLAHRAIRDKVGDENAIVVALDSERK